MSLSQSPSKSSSSLRKRSPRKLIPRPVKRKSVSSSSESNQVPKTLHHFFAKQTAKAKATKILRSNGDTSSKALVIGDSDSDEKSKKLGKHLARKLFSPSPTKRTNVAQGSGDELSQEATSTISSEVLTEDRVPNRESDACESNSQDAPRSDTKLLVEIISPLKEPNVELVDDDTDEVMGRLPEPETSTSKRATQNYEAQTFRHAYEKAIKKELFSYKDKKLLSSFFVLNEGAQELWLRLYQRKHQWILRSRISYNIDHIDSLLKELVEAGFLYDKTHLNDLKILLDLLPQKNVVALGRTFCDPKKCTTKAATIEELIIHAGRKDALFGAQRIRHNIVKCGQQLIEQCYFIEDSIAAAVTRILTLVSLGSHFDTFTTAADKSDHGVCNLFTISQFMRGNYFFPEYTVVDIVPTLFSNPEEFALYCDARQYVFRLSKLTETQKWDTALTKFEEAYKWFMSSCTKERFSKDAALPGFLQRFSYSYCLMRCLVIGAEIFERHKRYQDAIDLYYTVLSQTSLQQNRRGMYWIRLLLDIDSHLKLPRNSLCLASIGLKDSIAPQHMFDIYTRAKRLAERFEIFLPQLERFTPPIEAPIEVIYGQLTKRDIIGRRNVFATVDEIGEKIVGPEAVAIEHYLQHGYTNGVHGETRSIHMLFAVLCWDVLFAEPLETEPVPPAPKGIALTLEAELQAIKHLFKKDDVVNISDNDDEVDASTSPAKKRRRDRQSKRPPPKKKKVVPVGVQLIPHREYFRPDLFPKEVTSHRRNAWLQKASYINEFQSGPLDLGYPEFYLNRKRAIDQHLATLESITSDEMVSIAKKNYVLHSGRVNPLFSWEVLSVDEVTSLVACIPVTVIVAICRQLLVDFRFYRSGFPDIILWNEKTRRWKVVEVKGPGDILSTKQRYWMHLLLSLGVDCATCRIVSVHSRKIRI